MENILCNVCFYFFELEIHWFIYYKMEILEFLNFLNLSLILTHEIDAAIHKEWRLLYILRTIKNENTSSQIFVFLHVPLIFIMLYFLFHKRINKMKISRRILSIFLIIHGILHYRLSEDSLYTMYTETSYFTIFGGSLSGFLYLLFEKYIDQVK
jgi:hypothetical protein